MQQTTKVLASTKPNGPLYGSELALRLPSEQRLDYEYLHLAVCLSGASGFVTIDPLLLLIDSIIVEQQGDTKRHYDGWMLYILTYLSGKPDLSAIVAQDGTVRLIASLPFVVLTRDDIRVTIRFRENIDEAFIVTSIDLHSISAVRAPLIAAGHQRQLSLVSRSSFVASLSDVKILCAIVCRIRGCQRQKIQVEVRDLNTIICSDKDWEFHNSGGSGMINEFILSNIVPFLETSNSLRLHVISLSDETTPKIDIEWALIHGPETEGWVMLEETKKDGATRGTATRIEALRNWGAYYVPWLRKK